jgi:hypothetical protein
MGSVDTQDRGAVGGEEEATEWCCEKNCQEDNVVEGSVD